MARYIELPDGSALKLKEGQSPVEGMMAARQLFPELFKKEDSKPKEDTKGFKAAAAAGFERLKGESALTAAKLGLMDVAEAEEFQKKKQQAAAERFTPTEEGWSEAPFQKFKETLGGSVPYMVAPAAAGLAALAAPASVATGLGLAGAGALSAGQFTGSNLARQMETGKSLEEASLGKAVAAAVPQALVDTAAMALLPGVGKLFGSVGSKLTAEQAKAIASQTLTRTIADYTAKTGAAMGREGITEVAQQVLERIQAGLEIDDPEARKEYIESFIGGAVLGGALAPAGRAFERAGAKSQAAEVEKAEEQQRRATRLQKEQTALAQQKAQEDADAQALEAERQTPEYAVKLGAEYEALLQDYQTKQKALKTPGKTATPEEKAVYKEAQDEVKELYAKLGEMTPEYRRTKQIRAQEAEKARIAGMSPEEYALEQEQKQTVNTGQTEDLGVADPFAAAPTRESVYAQQRIQLAKTQAPEQGINGYADYLMTNPIMAQTLLESRAPLPLLVEPQRDKKKQEQEQRRAEKLLYAALENRLSDLNKEGRAQGRLGTGAAQQRLSVAEQEERDALEASREADRVAAEEADRRARLAPEMQALQRMKNAPSPMTENLGLFQNEEAPPTSSAAFGQLQQRLQGIPLGEGPLPTAEDVGPEGEQKRVLTRVPGAEFKLHPRAEGTGEPLTAESLRDRIDRVLSTYKLSPEAAAFLRRAEQVIPEADMTLKQEASARANQENIAGEVVASKGVQKNVSESQGFLTLLDQQLAKIESGEEGVARRGADRPELLKTFPPTRESQAQVSTTTPTEAFKYEQGATSAIPGQAASVSQADQYAQRERLERTGKPGKLPGFVAQPEEDDRTQGVPGRAKVEKRAQDINKPVYRTDPVTGKQELVSGTIRGESAQAIALSLQRELEPLVKLAETVRDEQAGQLSLFGAADERSRVQKAERRGIEAGPSLDTGARPDVESFQRFMNSPYVRKLRQDMKKSEKDLAPVRAFLARALPRLKQMLKESKDTTARMSKIKNWTKFLKENGELAAFQTNTENLVLKMNNLKLDVSELNARIKMYEQAKTQIIEEANRSGIRARGGAAETKVLQELDDLIALHEEAKAEFTQTKGALDLVRTQIKVLIGEQRLAELKATVNPLEKSNASAKAEIERLQETIRTAQAEVAEADNKVRQAEADKAQAEKGAKVANVQTLEKQISDERARRWNAALSGFGDRSEATYERSAADPDTGAAFLRTYPTYDMYKAEKSVQVRALGAAERDARERGLTADAAGEVKYKNELYNKPLLSLILELGNIDKQLAEATANVTAARKKSGSYVGGEQNVQAFKGLGSAIRLQSRLSVRKESLEDAINFMRARNVPLRKKLGAEPEVRAASIEEQDTLDQYMDQVQELGKAVDRLAALTIERDDAIKEGKTKTVAQLNEKIDKVNTEISIGTDEKAKLDLALKGRVSAGARQTTSAPGKLRAGTAESKRNAGVTKQPLVEQRNIKAPSVAQAVAEANALAEKRAAGEKNLTKAQLADIEAERQAEFQVILERRDEELTNQLDAAKDRLTTLQARAARPATGKSNLPSLEEIKSAELDVNDYDWERRAVRQELEAVKKALYQSANEADIRAAEEAAAEPVEKEAKPRGRPRKVTEEEAFGEATRAEGAVEDVYFTDNNDFKYSRGTPVEGLTTTELRNELRRAVGDEDTYSKKVSVYQSVDEFLNANPKYKDQIPSDAKAFVDPDTERAYMFADNIAKNEGLAILLHEVGVHIGFRNFFNAGQFKALANAVRGWSKAPANTLEGKIGRAAEKRVRDAATPADQVDDELIAYAVEEAVKAGVNPAGVKGGSAVVNWLRMIVNAFNKALAKFGIAPESVKVGDLVNMAYGAAQLELKGTWHGTAGSFQEFDHKYMNSGEGSQAFGWGTYRAERESIAQYYKRVAERNNSGRTMALVNAWYDLPEIKKWNAEGVNKPVYKGMTFDEAIAEWRKDKTANADIGAAIGLLENYYTEPYYKTEAEYRKAVTDLLDTARDNARAAVRLAPSEKIRKTHQKDLLALELIDAKDFDYRSDLPPTLLPEAPKGRLLRTLHGQPEEAFLNLDTPVLDQSARVGEALRKVFEALTDKQKARFNYELSGDSNPSGKDVYDAFKIAMGTQKEVSELMASFGIAGNKFLDRPSRNKPVSDESRYNYVDFMDKDQGAAIVGVNLNPIGPANNLLFSRKAQYGQDNALTDLSKQIIAQPKSFSDRLGRNIALETEMNLVDMRAGLREALKAGAKEMGDTKDFVQAMYSVTKADQKMAVVSSTLMNGPMEMYTDDKGFHGIRSSGKNSAKEVFDAIGRIPGGNARGRVDLATTYMIAQRAANKGLPKLDVGDLGVTEADLAAAMADVEANPELKNALEVVRSTYNAYNAGLIKFLASTGAIPKETAAKLLKDGDYVPFYRVRENGMADLVFSDEVTINIGDVRYQPYLAELKGGEARILPLTESLPRNTLLITDKALTNLAARNVSYAFQAIGAGKGPVDKEGKPTNAMPIHKGKGPTGSNIVRFNQEPDPKDPEDTGDRWVRVKTDDTIMAGIPAELIVKSLEGAHLTLPAFLKIGGIAGDILRSGVTRMPIYILRQLVRDPMAASFTGGLNYGPLTAVAKAGREFVRMTRGSSEAGEELIKKGLVQSGIFSGDPDDIAKMALQLAGNQQGAIDQLFAGLDRAAMRADAATRALVYDNAIKNGLSEVEADMATMESMNFYKRGLSPTVQYASRLIPFFNAQIQGLNVLYKAATGKMPFEEQQKIKQKFFNNALLLVGTGIVYAMAMEDDEYFRRAKPKDKYTNFFIPVPGVDEPFKLPIPYEAGWFFSLAVAAVDAMKAETDGKQQFDALRDMFLQSVPGYSSRGVPQVVKPAFEVFTNKNFFSGNNIESGRMEGKTPQERFGAATTEAAKALSKVLPFLSPVQIEHLASGYFGQLPLIIAAAADGLFRRESRGEAPEKRITDMPFIGSSFQKKFGGADADVVYRMANESTQAKNSYDSMIKQGRVEEAKEFLADNRAEIVGARLANQYKTQMGRLRSDEERITGMERMSAAEKRARIDKIDEARQALSERFEAAMKKIRDGGKT